jgi:hypothetical protein
VKQDGYEQQLLHWDKNGHVCSAATGVRPESKPAGTNKKTALYFPGLNSHLKFAMQI